jgi:hypothetical protein
LRSGGVYDDDAYAETFEWSLQERAAGLLLLWSGVYDWRRVVRMRNKWRSCRTQAGRTNSNFGKFHSQVLKVERVLGGEWRERIR